MVERPTGVQKEVGISEEQGRILDLLNSLYFTDQVLEKLRGATSEGEFLVPPGFPFRARQILSTAFDGVTKISSAELAPGSVIDFMVQEGEETMLISIKGGVSWGGGEMTVLTSRRGEDFDFGIRGGVPLNHLSGKMFFERVAPALPLSADVARADEQRRFGGLSRIEIGFNIPEGDLNKIEFVKGDVIPIKGVGGI